MADDMAERLADAERRAAHYWALAEDLNQRNHQAWVLVGAFTWAAEITLKALVENARTATWAREPYKLLDSALRQAKEALK